MADEEHVTRLKQGVDGWNKWRRERVAPLPPNLVGANLQTASLSGADLNGADLSGARLIAAKLIDASLNRATLSGADLIGAVLVRADLSGADLRSATLVSANLSDAKLNSADLGEANLRNADLRGTDLRGADLRGADLRRSKLIRAKLISANLSDATLWETIFADLDLTSVVGLDTCQHRGPSMIDHRTLQKSSSLPIPFLRGSGLPDALIDYLPSLFNQSIQYYSCFISYSAKDQDFADRIHADLQNKGVRCWFAPHDMPIGGKILDEIDAAIRVRDKVLLILSEHSIKSDWVEDEVTKGFEEERKRGQIVLFPIRLDDAVMDTEEAWAAKLRAQRNIGDFRHWEDHNGYKKGFERVLRDLAPKAKPS